MILANTRFDKISKRKGHTSHLQTSLETRKAGGRQCAQILKVHSGKGSAGVHVSIIWWDVYVCVYVLLQSFPLRVWVFVASCRLFCCSNAFPGSKQVNQRQGNQTETKTKLIYLDMYVLKGKSKKTILRQSFHWISPDQSQTPSKIQETEEEKDTNQQIHFSATVSRCSHSMKQVLEKCVASLFLLTLFGFGRS